MIVGISIDDVFRNFSENFIITLDKLYGGVINREKVFDENGDSLGFENVIRYETDEKIDERVDYDLLKIANKYGIENKKTLYTHLYDEYSFEFFATCDLIDKTLKLPNKFNKLIIDLEEDYEEEIEILLIDRGYSRSITSTFFFLSKCGLYPSNIKFVKNYGDEWNYVDILVTANNETLNFKPLDKISIKINTEYNSEIISDYTYNNLEEAIDSINIIINKKISNEN
jgi:hypothetical protein